MLVVALLFPLLVSGAAVNRRSVSSAEYNILESHFKYASSAYASSCAKPNGAHLLKAFSHSATHTAGYIARDDNAKEFIVAFRGSTTSADTATLKKDKLVNLTSTGVPKSLGGALVHEGFLAAYNGVASTIISTLKPLKDSTKYQSYAVVAVGHDIGGGIAAIAGVALSYVLELDGGPSHTYTYGQPRTGNLAWMFLVDELQGFFVSRVVHTNDGFVNVIPRSPTDGYRHHGIEYWLQHDPPSPAHTVECAENEVCSFTVTAVGNNAAHRTYFDIPYNKAFCS